MSTPTPTPTALPTLDTSNPLAYLSYLPPSLAYESTIGVYVLVASLVVQIWDIFNNLNEDYKLLTRNPIRAPAVVISTLAYLLFAVIYQTAPIGNCQVLSKVGSLLFCIAMPATALLFYFRVTALYNNKYVSAFFFVLWLGLLGGTATDIVGIDGYNIGPTRHCSGGTLKPIVSSIAFGVLVNDSLIFVAISFRLMQIAQPEEMKLKEVLKAVVFGNNLPAFSRALLRDGQAYYLTTNTASFIYIVIFYINSIPLLYRLIFGVPNFALTNILACRVYRRTKSGQYREYSTMNLSLPLEFLEEPRVGNATLGLAEPPVIDISRSRVFA
ncbi:hypothetical protein GALMADRAFT_71553 [Galerina marginata CBS 339.88]|uniref:Uncharacterized protein n=1 Tax=Galerina marginata (strain CBS 339.88) TaxID=685588 RepID=A0A067SSI9_GALM3|nr:hypothetical protein GALMADRAFT_71553 [Galerina marginata CBS 339.88]